jgi:hypothetical protein
MPAIQLTDSLMGAGERLNETQGADWPRGSSAELLLVRLRRPAPNQVVCNRVCLPGRLENVQPCGIIIASATVKIPRPNSFRNEQPRLRTLAFGLALLGLCVVAWGLKYKLSLYDPPQAVSHHMAAAKLLSGKERNSVPLVTASPAAKNPANSVVPFALTTLTLAFFGFAAATFFIRFDISPLRLSPRGIALAWVRSAPAFTRPPPRLR